jgi:uncharacterized protein (TIGR02001 family)
MGSIAHADGVSVTATPSVVSQYMFRGVRLGGPSLQPSVEMGSGNLALGIWASTPLKDKVVGQSDPEIDPYGSYTFAVNDSLSIVPGFTYYTYLDANTGNGFYKSTFEPSVAVNYTVSGVKFTPKFYYDTVLEGPTYELTIAYTVPMKEMGTELSFAVSGGTFMWKDAVKNSAPKTKNWGDYYQVGVTAPFEITKTSKLILGLAYAEGSGNYYKTGTAPKSENTAAVGRGIATISYAISF